LYLILEHFEHKHSLKPKDKFPPNFLIFAPPPEDLRDAFCIPGVLLESLLPASQTNGSQRIWNYEWSAEWYIIPSTERRDPLSMAGGHPWQYVCEILHACLSQFVTVFVWYVTVWEWRR